VILLIGESTDGPLAAVRKALDVRGDRYFLLDRRACAETRLTRTALRSRRTTCPLSTVTGVHVRDAAGPSCPAAHRLHRDLAPWLEDSAARVLNRPSASATNLSKTFQLQLIREAGFAVPETLVTDSPEDVAAFRAEHGLVVCKSVSSRRSVVRLLTDEAMARIERVRWCPTQFQQYVDGVNVRVHVVGDRHFATAVHTTAVDYRYPQRRSETPVFCGVGLPGPLLRRCHRLAASLGLPLAGIDLRIAPDGTAYCLEANPSPAFTYYESMTGQPIARAVAELLLGRPDSRQPGNRYNQLPG
jgi:glutathione synthase/RimK-type ligase-like ATP-grasp enzyme